MRNRLAAFSLVTGLTLLMFVTGAMMIPSLLFLVNISVTMLHVWLAAGLAAGVAWIAAKMVQAERPGRLFAEAIIASCILFVACFFISGYFYDLSYDGQAYHQESIIHLDNGWNPVYDEPLNVPTGHSLWMNHYARASELAAAVLFKATGLLEHSKAINGLTIFASFFLSLSALLTLRPSSNSKAVLVALLLAFNPVSVYQALSYYVDGLLSSMLLCMVALGCLIFARPGWLLLTAYTSAMIFAINIKFTALAYAGLLTIGLLIALYMSEQFGRLKQLFKIAAVGGLVGVLLIGYNPYVTNTLTKGHPFYPLAGEEAIDVVKNFTPRNLERMNRLEQLGASYFAVTTGNSTEKLPTKIKLPFTVSEKELVALGDPDVAVSGFGPLFSGVLLLSLAVLVLAFRYRKGATMAAIGVIVLLAGSVIVNPAAWWARYVPQLWIVPIICLWLGFSMQGRRLLTGASWTLAAVIAVNALLVTGTYTYHQWEWNQSLREELAAVQTAAAKGPVRTEFTYSWANRERFEELGIAFKEEIDLACDDKMTLTKSGTSVCMPPQ
ncbi:hypothetical protein ACFQ88_33360 [Paenibacillus sp. NPDC056579]|uniref:hypothetical protein n=1 Tax=unclassified Paenibacillus TaxID=185978 RepID=UPI001EF82DD0|nr:hypothetical protein [Paenibacillus sp. H1-7]ULL13625.1 hypothetical protein DVH26_03670 [Paenibacillus sp. H1-7]